MPLRSTHLLLALLSLAGLVGCSSTNEPGMARSLDYDRPGEPPPPAPEVKPLKPKEIRLGVETPLRPAWKGERVRALDLDGGARAEVSEARSRVSPDPEVRKAAAKAKRAHAARARVSRRRAERALAAIEHNEADERKRLRAEAATRRTVSYAKVRQEVYLEAARQRAGRGRSADLVPASRKIAGQAAFRAQACVQLHSEQIDRVARTRRLTLATLAQGMAVPGGRLELRHEVRRLTEVALVMDQAEAELLYARAVAQRLDAEWNLALGKDDPER